MSVRTPPNPLFVHFGIDGGATCSHLTGNWLFIGSVQGKVRLYRIDSNLLENVVYENDDNNKIQSLCYSDDVLFVHIRAFAIISLRKPTNIREVWQKYEVIELGHVGFCNLLILDNELIFASSELNEQILCWTTENRKKEYSLKMGTNTQITPMHMALSIGGKGITLLVGMEDGNMVICEKNEELEGFKLSSEKIRIGRDPIFCVATCSKWIGIGCAKSPISLLPKNDMISTPKLIHYQQTSSGCSSLVFSPSSKQLLAGFWDGTIRVFSCNRLSVLLCLSSTHSATITSLIWRAENEQKKEEEIVVATSLDGSLSTWKFK